jgi:hypothetical protein
LVALPPLDHVGTGVKSSVIIGPEDDDADVVVEATSPPNRCHHGPIEGVELLR